MHQEHTTHQSQAATTLAPDPLRKFTRSFFIFFGIFLVAIAFLIIALYFVPEPLRDELTTLKLPDPFFYIQLIIPLGSYPFGLFLIGNTLGEKRWKQLKQDRQQAFKDYVNGDKTWKTYPLPEYSDPLSTTVSVQMRRNWRTTWIAGAIYSIPISLLLFICTLYWQSGMQYIVEMSGWVFLCTLLWLLLWLSFTCIFCLPVLAVFLFAPHQKLIATRSGLFCYRYLRLSYIPWEEARLFAVIHKAGGSQVYELSSSTQVIRWSSKPESQSMGTFPVGTTGIAPLGLIQAEKSSEEYQWQILQLILMVADGTGLPLYDLRQ